jgi:rod shape determining protein RodA
VLLPGLLTLPGLLLILAQPDLGTAMSFTFIYLSMVLMAGPHTKAFGLVALFTVMLFPFLWELFWASLHGYQRERILTFWNPAVDPAGKGYHALQSQIAIGSGGLFGKGLDEATQSRLRFLPEGHTDFVFAVFAEQWGFLGVLVLFALFVALIVLAAEIALKAKDALGLLLAAGIVTMLGFGLIVNTGMTMGLFPIVGIPLPLMSYGGTTTVTAMAALGLLLNVKRRRLTLFY